MTNPRSLRLALAVSAIAPAALALGHIAQMEWAAGTWPYEIGPLSRYFLGAILAAIAVAVIWVSASGDLGALRASAPFPLLMLAAIAVYLVGRELATDDRGLIPFAIAMAIGAAYAAAAFAVGSRSPVRDRRPLPPLARGSFVLFALVLIAAGAALALGATELIPWPASDESKAMFGLIFLGASASYVYGAVRPMWGYAYAPLLGFLAYDVVLLGPLIDHFSKVAPEQRTSLVVYVAVLAYSGALAVHYLLISRETRLRRPRADRR